MQPARPISVNATAAALLGLLCAGPMTGGELVIAAEGRFGSFFSLTRSQVYRELPVLADAGLLRPGRLGARSAQQYRITAVGKRAFRAWLTGPGGADSLRSPLVLRLLYAAEIPAGELDTLLTTSRKAYEEQLAQACAVADTVTDPSGQAVAEFVVTHMRAMLTLLDSVPSGA